VADELSERLARLEGRFPEFDRRMEERFRASERASEVALSAAREATSKADSALEKRLDNTNEWRKSYDDLARQKQGREEAATRFYMTMALSLLALLVSIAGVVARLRG